MAQRLRDFLRLNTNILAMSGMVSLGVAILTMFGFAMATPQSQLNAIRVDHEELAKQIKADSIYWSNENARQDSIVSLAASDIRDLLIFRCIETAPKIMRDKGQFRTASRCESLLKTGNVGP